MDQPVEDTLIVEPPRRGWLALVVMSAIGIALGCAIAIGFLLWWDHDRWQRWESERLEALATVDRRALAAKEREDVAAPKDQLARFNDQFRDIYRVVRSEAVAHASPLVIVSGDELILYHKGERTPVKYLPDRFHQLKAFAHIPLAAYLVTGLEAGNTELPSSRQTELKKLLERLPELREELNKRGDAAEVVARQEKIIGDTETFLNECHKRAYTKQPIGARERAEFAGKLREPIRANVREAARVQIDALDKQMAQWRNELKDDEWKRLKVIVIGSAMPRKNNIAVQYFAWLLGERGEDRRIVYAEGLFEEPRAMNLLGTHVVDEDIGRAFFAEPTRMKRDLLGDDAEKILEEMTRARKE